MRGNPPDNKMPINAYCRKCKQEVQPGETCPLCGGKLAKNSLRLSWYYDRHPATDWISWNGICRVFFPVLAVVTVLIIGGEWILRGFTGVQTLLAQGVIQILLGITLLALAGAALWLTLMGEDVLYFVLDAKGIHMQTYIPNPTKRKLWLRMQGNQSSEMWEIEGRQEEMLLLGEKLVTWAEIRRVQLWPEKEKILLHNPKWWMTMAIHCKLENYDEAIYFIYQRLQKKKDVILPPAMAMAQEPIAEPAPMDADVPPLTE